MAKKKSSIKKLSIKKVKYLISHNIFFKILKSHPPQRMNVEGGGKKLKF